MGNQLGWENRVSGSYDRKDKNSETEIKFLISLRIQTNYTSGSGSS